MSTDRTDGPQKVVLGSYSSHAAAQHVVDILAEHNFPVEHVTIVGSGLRLQEIVLGRWTLGRALVSGAFTGGWIGLLVGLVFLIVSPWAPQSVISAIVIGIVLGLIWAAVARMWQRRSFAAVPAVVAERYDVLVDAPLAEEARRMVSAALGAPADRPARPT
jgi:ascorbate-specific PTS system EIIC-type component UlaA